MPLVPVNFKCSSEFRSALVFALYENLREQNKSATIADSYANFHTAYTVVQSGHVVYLQATRVLQLMELFADIGVDVQVLTLQLEVHPTDDEEF